MWHYGRLRVIQRCFSDRLTVRHYGRGRGISSTSRRGFADLTTPTSLKDISVTTQAPPGQKDEVDNDYNQNLVTFESTGTTNSNQSSTAITNLELLSSVTHNLQKISINREGLVASMQDLLNSRNTGDQTGSSDSNVELEAEAHEDFEEPVVDNVSENKATSTTPNEEIETTSISNECHLPSLAKKKNRERLRYGLWCLGKMRNAMSSNNVVSFFFIEIKWWEWDRKKCTEFGIAKLSNFAKPVNKSANFEYCLHFVVKDFFNKRNGKFVPDQRGDLNEEFSKKSILIYAKNLGANINRLTAAAKRRGEVYLVVHDRTFDVPQLQKLGCETNGMEILDTREMARALVYESSGRYATDHSSLGSILTRYGIASKKLHNGGNGAHYLMQAFQAMAAAEKGDYSLDDLTYT